VARLPLQPMAVTPALPSSYPRVLQPQLQASLQAQETAAQQLLQPPAATAATQQLQPPTPTAAALLQPTHMQQGVGMSGAVGAAGVRGLLLLVLLLLRNMGAAM
jgi:hypothetical protein